MVSRLSCLTTAVNSMCSILVKQGSENVPTGWKLTRVARKRASILAPVGVCITYIYTSIYHVVSSSFIACLFCCLPAILLYFQVKSGEISMDKVCHRLGCVQGRLRALSLS